MGMELPAELAGVARDVGLSWPQADEDALARQAGAWRAAQRELTALAGDADATAAKALSAMEGPAADAARARWAGFVAPDHGHLTATAAGAGQAADRLEHAAERVGAAKAEMVRQLVAAAKNSEAARAAAAAGHPAALLGVDTLLRGTATNLAAVTGGLLGALGPGGGAAVSAVTEPVPSNPGVHAGHGQAGLLGAVTGLPSGIAGTAVSTVDAAAGGAVARLADPGYVPGVVGSVLDGGATVAEVAGSVVPVPASDPPPPPAPVLPPVPPDSLPVDPADAGTGPIRLGGAPPASRHGGSPLPGMPDDAPTPPAGLPAQAGHGAPAPPGHTTAAGFTGGAVAGPHPLTPPSPVIPPIAGGQPVAPAPGPFTGGPQAAPFAPQGGPTAGAAPGAPVPVPGALPPRPQPGSARPGPAVEHPGAYPGARSDAAAPVPAPPPPAPPRLGAPRQERESVAALFLVHMFPIGHLPVACDRPARQLPPPPPDVDYAAGLRFPPHDHPDSSLIDATAALERLAANAPLPDPPVPDGAVGVPLAGHDPLGGLHEREWDRRYLAGTRGGIAEYAWPPGEVYPEGGGEPGEPVALASGTMIDRFGVPGGRVFAEDGTPFARRSLPPSHLQAGYRRYRVLRELPVWRAVSVGWFGQPGGGVRYRAVYPAAELVTLGYLADITTEPSAEGENR